jgi:hypothetical protein
MMRRLWWERPRLRFGLIAAADDLKVEVPTNDYPTKES